MTLQKYMRHKSIMTLVYTVSQEGASIEGCGILSRDVRDWIKSPDMPKHIRALGKERLCFLGRACANGHI